MGVCKGVHRWSVAQSASYILLALVCLELTGGSAGEDAHSIRPSLRILFPADRSIIETGKFQLICVQRPQSHQKDAPRLVVDGVRMRWGQYRPPVFVARLNLSPGRHKLQIGNRTLAIFIRGNRTLPAPRGWQVFRAHPPASNGYMECRSCHNVKRDKDAIAVLTPRTPDACGRCHSDVQFEVKHFHPKEPLDSCQMCHAVHGSSRKALLKKPLKELCATCHD